MDCKFNYPINLAYCIDTAETADRLAADKLVLALGKHFKDKKHSAGFNIGVYKNNATVIVTISGDMTVEYTLVNTSSPTYHVETDGESSFDCMTEEDFRQMIINAFRKCATDILSAEILEKDGSVRNIYMSEDIEDYLSWNEDVGYPSDNEIWGLLEFHELVA